MFDKEKKWEGLEEQRRQGRMLWNRACIHSRTYMKHLGIDEEELERLQASCSSSDEAGSAGRKRKAFMALNTYGEEFAFFARQAKGTVYGGEWENLVFCVCASNLGINYVTGRGTTLISALPDIWHQRVVRILADT